MCEAATLGVVAAAAAYSAYSQYQEGKQTQQYYDYLAKQKEAQSADIDFVTDKNISSVYSQAANETKDVKEQYAQVEGTQAASMAASGIAGSVTAQDIKLDTLTKKEQDEMAIRYNADMMANKMRYEAYAQKKDIANQVSMDKLSGKQAVRTGKIRAGGSLLSGASQVGQSWYSNRSSSSSWRPYGSGDTVNTPAGSYNKLID